MYRVKNNIVTNYVQISCFLNYWTHLYSNMKIFPYCQFGACVTAVNCWIRPFIPTLAVQRLCIYDGPQHSILQQSSVSKSTTGVSTPNTLYLRTQMPCSDVIISVGITNTISNIILRKNYIEWLVIRFRHLLIGHIVWWFVFLHNR